MTARLAVFVWRMWAVGRVPIEYSVPAFSACIRFEVDCETLGGYLISEHGNDWTDQPEKCSHRKACGPYQLVRHWPREFGYESEDRLCPWLSAEIMAQVILYSVEKTKKERSSFDWRARLKCSRKSRETCKFPVLKWRRLEDRLSLWSAVSASLDQS